MSLVHQPSSSPIQTMENIFAQCSLEIVLAYLQTKLTEKLTNYDLDALKSYEAGVLEFKRSRLPSLGRKNAMELAVQFLTEIARKVDSFNKENLQNIEQVKMDLSNLICVTAAKFSEIKDISVWILRSDNQKLGVLRKVLALDDEKGTIRDAEMTDSAPSDPSVGAWIDAMDSCIGDLFGKYGNLRKLISAIHEDAVEFFSKFNGALRLLINNSGSQNCHGSFDSAMIKGIELDGSLDLLMAYVQNAINRDTIALAPKQADLLQAGEHLVKHIKRLENGFLASLELLCKHAEQYSTLLKTIKALCEKQTLITVVNHSKASFRKQKNGQSKDLNDAIQQARSGRLSASRAMYNALISKAYLFELRYDEVKDAARECQELIMHLEKHINRCHAAYAKLDNKWKNFLGQDVSDLQRLLIMVNSAIKGSGWHRDGEAWKKVEALIYSLEPVCEFAEISFSWLPLSFSGNSFGKPIRRLSAIEVFVNCLCAIAACDGDFCVSEQRAVLSVSQRVAPNATEEQIIALIRNWVHQSRQAGLDAYISQCVADSVILRNTQFASVAKQAFLFILNADGEQEENEIFVAKSMLQRFT